MMLELSSIYGKTSRQQKYYRILAPLRITLSFTTEVLKAGVYIEEVSSSDPNPPSLSSEHLSSFLTRWSDNTTC